MGERKGFGTYETFYNHHKYTREQAYEAKCYTVVDFVQDENGIKYLQAYHAQFPKYVLREKMLIQHFPFGIDQRDDWMAESMFKKLTLRYESNDNGQ